MIRTANWIVGLFLVGFLFAPAASWLWADRRPNFAPTGVAALFNATPGGRDNAANVLIGESPLGASIAGLKNRFDYYAVRVVSTPEVVSGDWPWLFYRQQFDKGRCLPEASIRSGLAGLEALRLVAAGAGIEMIVTVSPDKAVIYPDKLGVQGTAAAGCKLRSAAAWRAWAKANGSSIIDHAPALTGPTAAGIQTYDATDTHWNPIGYAYMLDQMAGLLAGKHLPDPHVANPPTKSMVMGILGIMLKIDDQEVQPQLTPEWIAEATRILAPPLEDVVVLHDSFYGRYRSLLELLIAGDRFFDMNRWLGPRFIEAVEARPRLLIVNTVERMLFTRLSGRATLAPGGALGLALLAANARASEACVFGEGAPLAIEHAGKIGSGAIRLPASDKPVCLRIAFAGRKDEDAVLLLPPPPGFPVGGEVPLRSFRGNTIRLVLPASVAGASVGLRLASRQHNPPVVATGTLP